MHDVTAPVRLTIERSTSDGGAVTVRATARIDRTEFEITAQRGTAGRYLDVVNDVRWTRR